MGHVSLCGCRGYHEEPFDAMVAHAMEGETGENLTGVDDCGECDLPSPPIGDEGAGE